MRDDFAPEGQIRSSRQRWLWVAGFSVAAVALTTGLAVVGWCWSGAERTELAQWAMAAAAMLTLIAAVSAAVFAAGAFSLESTREDRWHDTQRRAQASLVAAWSVGGVKKINRVGTADEQGEEGRAVKTTLTVDAVLRNASEVPVTEVVVTPGVATYLVDGHTEEWVGWFAGESKRFPVLPPSVEPVRIKLQFQDSRAQVEELRQGYGEEANFKREPFVGIEFNDAAGVRWARDSNHYLRELPPGRIDGIRPI